MEEPETFSQDRRQEGRGRWAATWEGPDPSSIKK